MRIDTDKLTMPSFGARVSMKFRLKWTFFPEQDQGIKSIIHWARLFFPQWKKLPKILINEITIAFKARKHAVITVEELSGLIAVREDLQSFLRGKKKTEGISMFAQATVGKKTGKLLDKFRKNITSRTLTWKNDPDGATQIACGISFENLVILVRKNSDNDKKLNEKSNINFKTIYSNHRERLIEYHEYNRTASRGCEDQINFKNCIFLNAGNTENAWQFDEPDIIFEKNEPNSINFSKCVLADIRIGIFETSKILQENDDSMERVNALCGQVKFESVKSIYSGGILTKSSIEHSKLNASNNENLLADWFMTKIVLKDCRLHLFRAQPSFLKLFGANTIKGISFRELGKKKFVARGGIRDSDSWEAKIKPIIEWGMYQNIEPLDRDWTNHKKHLRGFLNLSREFSDNFQINILNREIMKCDHELINREPWSKSLQDRLTFGFNKWVSNYGISWFRPIGCILMVNLSISVLTTLIIGKERLFSITESDSVFSNVILIFAQLLNPISTFESIILVNYAKLPTDIHFPFVMLHTFQKIIFAICIYEVIRAARRFTRTGS